MPTGHRRLLEHLADPACPSIRRFVENFPQNVPQSIPPTLRAEEEPQVPSPASSFSEAGCESNRSKTFVADGTDVEVETAKNGSAGVVEGGNSGIGRGCRVGDVDGGIAKAGDIHTAEGSGGVLAQGTTTTTTTADELREAYNGCLSALGDFR